jgi:hypothetical protein
VFGVDWVGGRACITIMGLEFGSIYIDPLALHFSLTFHVIDANIRSYVGQNTLGLLREHELPTIKGHLDYGKSVCEHAIACVGLGNYGVN